MDVTEPEQLLEAVEGRVEQRRRGRSSARSSRRARRASSAPAPARDRARRPGTQPDGCWLDLDDVDDAEDRRRPQPEDVLHARPSRRRPRRRGAAARTRGRVARSARRRATRRNSSDVAGSSRSRLARGLAARLRAVLDMNWLDSGDALVVDAERLADERDVGDAVGRRRAQHGRDRAGEAALDRAERHRRQSGSWSCRLTCAPAPGPGDWSNASLTTISKATTSCGISRRISDGGNPSISTTAWKKASVWVAARSRSSGVAGSTSTTSPFNCADCSVRTSAPVTTRVPARLATASGSSALMTTRRRSGVACRRRWSAHARAAGARRRAGRARRRGSRRRRRVQEIRSAHVLPPFSECFRSCAPEARASSATGSGCRPSRSTT